MTGRTLRCGSADGRSDIALHWRIPARLSEVRPGKWVGPCPKDGEPAALNVAVGRNGAVIWNVPGCKGKHDRAAAYPALKTLVPCAPDPGQERNPELEALVSTLIPILTNKTFTIAGLRLAGLEAIGIDQGQALDMLGIADRSNRRRAIRDARRALAASPAKMVKIDHNRRSEPPGRAKRGNRQSQAEQDPPPVPDPQPAETRLPVGMVNSDPPRLSVLTTTAGQESGPKMPVTSTFPGLTHRASVVSGPAGWIRDTTTALGLALETLKADLNAEGVKAWAPLEEGPCGRCGARTCRYGDRGSPLCAKCRTRAEVQQQA